MILLDFSHYFSLPENLWRSLYSEYSEWKSQGISDPYIQCLYLVLGRIESRPPSTLANLLGTTEDFLWFLVFFSLQSVLIVLVILFMVAFFDFTFFSSFQC